MKELGGKTEVLVGPDLSSVGGGTKVGGPIPTLGQLSESEEKHLRLGLKQLICGSLNGQSLPQPYIPRTGKLVPWKAQQLGAGVNGLQRNPRTRAAVDFRETDRGDMREEIVVGNACGGKPGSLGSKVILPSHG